MLYDAGHVMPPGKIYQLGETIGKFDIGDELVGTFTLKDGSTVQRKLSLDYSPDGVGLTIPPVHPHCRCSMRPILDDEVS